MHAHTRTHSHRLTNWDKVTKKITEKDLKAENMIPVTRVLIVEGEPK